MPSPFDSRTCRQFSVEATFIYSHLLLFALNLLLLSRVVFVYWSTPVYHAGYWTLLVQGYAAAVIGMLCFISACDAIERTFYGRDRSVGLLERLFQSFVLLVASGMTVAAVYHNYAALGA